MNEPDDRPDLTDLFATQAEAVDVSETSRLSEITGAASSTGGGGRGATRAVMAAAAALLVVSGLVGIGTWRSADVPEVQSVGGSVAPTVGDPALLPRQTDDPRAATPEPTFPTAGPDATNVLVTGADNNACVDPHSPYAPALGVGEPLGERSDTVMMWRVDPGTSQVAVLSFPRDLWVTIDGKATQQRISSVYERDNPQRLIDTIYDNFGIVTDHFLQVDFCAFKTLVDAVGGVTIPFSTALRDESTGLAVPGPGCYTLDGDHALAYVRSRKLETSTPGGDWIVDPTADLGRISRQQDFMLRTLDQLVDSGAFEPGVVARLLETVSEYIVTDPDLTPHRMLELAGVLSQGDPATIATFQIEAAAKTIQGNAVLEPRLDSANMRAILAVFRGESASAGTTEGASESTPTDATTSATVPAVVAEENTVGAVPVADQDCP
jgi:LCP family protein required for cell wall assembly